MKHRTATLEGALLDAAVALAEGWTKADDDPTGWWSPDRKNAASIEKRGIREGYGYHPAHNWAQGGPIIDRERIALLPPQGIHQTWWEAMVRPVLGYDGYEADHEAEGPTALVAAMRAYVASKLGEEVELP